MRGPSTSYTEVLPELRATGSLSAHPPSPNLLMPRALLPVLSEARPHACAGQGGKGCERGKGLEGGPAILLAFLPQKPLRARPPAGAALWGSTICHFLSAQGRLTLQGCR